MPVKLSLLERIAFRLNMGPAPVLDYVGALGLRAACSAERLGVFELLRESCRSDAEIAQRLEMDQRGMSAMLDALEAVGYVRRRNGRCELTIMSAKWPPRFRDGVAWFEGMAVDGWPDVEARLRGEARPHEGVPEDGGEGSALARALGALSNARLMADEVVRRLRIGDSARRLLDVGGGHGLYSARLCRRHAGLTATVVDDDEVALEVAGRVLAEERMAERVQLRQMDIFDGDLGSGYDGALLFNTLNLFEPERRIELLARIGVAIGPNGFVAILDQMRLPSRSGAARAVADLTNLRLFDPASRGAYGVSDLGWLGQAGMRHVRTSSLMSAPWMGLLIVRRTGR